MKKQKIILISVVVLVCIVIAKLVWTYFSASTPIQHAERQSELSLPDGIKLVRFEEDWKNANGDGWRKIEFELTSHQITELQRQCLIKSYKRLPVIENGYMPSYLNKVDKGFYKLKLLSKNNPWDYEITILDIKEKKLYVILQIT